MGSTLAGVKAGVLAGVAYVGSLAVFNVIVLYAAEPAVLEYIGNNFSRVCNAVPTVNGTSIQDCFASIAPVYIPFIAFVAFFLSLLYSGIFGRFYERIPGGKVTKGMITACVVALNLAFFQLTGLTFETSITAAITVFLVCATAAYGVMLGELYVRYTRIVKFDSEDPESLRIVVDGRDYTGRSLTFAAKSTHTVKAEASEGASFKEWAVSGGVTLEDQRSFETPMEVDGDGMVKASLSRKY